MNMQICPKCNGQGTVSKPPWVDGDVSQWISTQSGGYTCKICQGCGIIYLQNDSTSAPSVVKGE